MKRICKKCQVEKSSRGFEKTKSGWRHVCKECRRGYWRGLYEGDPSRKKLISAHSKNRRQRNMLAIWEYLKSHPCVDCGEDDPVVLEFDHVRGLKKLAISTMIEGYTLENIMLEIAKCDVRCANCHRRKTAKQRGHYEYL